MTESALIKLYLLCFVFVIVLNGVVSLVCFGSDNNKTWNEVNDRWSQSGSHHNKPLYNRAIRNARPEEIAEIQEFLLRDAGYIQYKEVSGKFSFELNYPCKNNFKLRYEIATQKKNNNQTFSYVDFTCRLN